MNEKKDTISVYASNLASTPGWGLLPQETQQLLLDRTAILMDHHRVKGVAAVSECLELIGIKKILEDGPVRMEDYLRNVYGKSRITGFRVMRAYRALVKLRWENVAERLAEAGFDLLQGATGVQMNTLVSVAKMLPAPTNNDPKTIDAFIEKKVRPAISELKRAPRKGQTTPLDVKDAEKQAFNAVMRYIRRARLETIADQRKWLAGVMGWTMEALAIDEPLYACRIPIPEGTIAMMGRPRKQIRERDGRPGHRASKRP